MPRSLSTKFVAHKGRKDVGNWYLYFRPALPDGTSLIPIPGLSRPDQRPAARAFADTYRAAAKDIVSHPKRETADRWYDRFVQSRAGKVSTADTDHKQWRKWISPVKVATGTFGERPIEDVNADDIEAVRDRLNDAIDEWEGAGKTRGVGMSFSTAANVWSILTCAMKHARTRKGSRTLRVDDKGSPCVGIAPPRRGRSKRRHWLRSAWLNAALASPANARNMKEAVAIGVGLHLRPGELHELRVRDVDLDANEVAIRRSFDERSKTVGETKSEEGVRTVTIPAWLRPLLARIVKERKPNERIAPWLAATPEDERADAFRTFLRNSGAAPEHIFEDSPTHEKIDFRSVRDTGITLRFLAGERAEVVQREAGHEDVKTTLGYAKEVANKGGRYGAAHLTLPPDLAPPRGAGGRAASCEVDGKCDAGPLENQHGMVARVGFEGTTSRDVASTCDGPWEVSQHDAPGRDVSTRGTSLRELAALATAARELLRSGLNAEARPLVDRLAAALERAVASAPRAVDLVAERARRRVS